MRNDKLDDRMKEYERVTRHHLTKRTPVIIRIDGKAFHTFTKGFEKPFDEVMVNTMQDTMKYLCENIENCVLGYTQSDEITLVLCDYKTLTSQSWFNNNLQKLCSVSASMATMAFNKFFEENTEEWNDNEFSKVEIDGVDIVNIEQHERWFSYNSAHNSACVKGAMFDSRAFNMPKEEVNNCLIWRQEDAARNSIQSVAQANFKCEQLDGKNQNELQEMLWQEKGINWNDYPTYLKRGSCCIRIAETKINETGEPYIRQKWAIDSDIPIFSKDPSYVNNRINFE